MRHPLICHFGFATFDWTRSGTRQLSIGSQHVQNKNHLPAKVRLAAIACGLLVALSQTALGRQQPQLSPEARRTLAQVVELVEQTFTLGGGKKPIIRLRELNAAARLFAEALDKLSAQVGAARCEQLKPSEGREIEAKLIAIACDRSKRGDAYREIESVYIKGVHSTESAFPRSPEVQDIHATENYRLPWEFYLLSPPTEEASPLYDLRAAKAIGLIRNNASIVTLLFAFRITTLKGVNPKRVEDRQTQLLNAMNAFANEQALRAMLESLTLSQKQPGGSAWDVRNYIYRLLSDQEDSGNGPQWKKVIGAFPTGGLPEDQRQLLQDALHALERGPK